MINSISSAGSGISAAGVDCRLDDVFVDAGAAEVRGSSSSAVCRILARVAFRRSVLSSFVSVSKGLLGRIRDAQQLLYHAPPARGGSSFPHLG